MDDTSPRMSPDGVPSGATMRPVYMGRVVNTYPVSDFELERISSLNDQVVTRFTTAGSLLALAAGIFTNAVFNDKLSDVAYLATIFVAPLLLLFSVGFGVGGIIARNKKTSAWDKIKTESLPVQSMAAATPLISGPPAS
jgi:hypothetical protein